MKILIFINLIFVINIFPQIQLDPILSDLDSPNPLKRFQALMKIEEDSLFEYTDELKTRIFNEQVAGITRQYMSVLIHLNASDLSEFAEEFLLKANEFVNMYPPEDPLESKVEILNVFFKERNYTHVDLLMQYLERERNKNEISPHIVSQFGEYLLFNVDYELYAKNELIYVLQNDINSHTRSFALYYLGKRYGDQLSSLFTDVFENDLEMFVRQRALIILCEFRPNNLQTVLQDRLHNDSDWPFRNIIADTLLNIYGTPADLKTVIDHAAIEQNDIAKWNFGYSIRKFIPPRPTISTSEMIQNLLVYCSELLEYGWITEEYVYEEISQMIALIEENYHGQAVPELCSNLETYLDLVEDRFNQSVITIEAYKFLFYHGNYIKDNVELEFGDCQ